MASCRLRENFCEIRISCNVEFRITCHLPVPFSILGIVRDYLGLCEIIIRKVLEDMSLDSSNPSRIIFAIARRSREGKNKGGCTKNETEGRKGNGDTEERRGRIVAKQKQRMELKLRKRKRISRSVRR